jgi:hypothetical protein
MSVYRDAGRKHNRKIANKLLKTVGKFTFLKTIVTNLNYTHEEIQDGSNSGILATIHDTIFEHSF